MNPPRNLPGTHNKIVPADVVGIFCLDSQVPRELQERARRFGLDPVTSGKDASGNTGESEFDRIRRVHGEHADMLFASVLQGQKIAPLQGAFAHLWLNRDPKEGNRLLREAHLAIIKNEGGIRAWWNMTPARRIM